MKIIQILKDWRKCTQDPVKHCMVYRAVGCAHVDGMLCNMRTCDIVVNISLTPNSVSEIERDGRYEEIHNVEEK